MAPSSQELEPPQIPGRFTLLTVALGIWLGLQWLAFPSWMGEPPLWLRANLQTTLMLLAMGVALFFRASTEGAILPHRASSVIALAGAMFALVVLLQNLLGLESGLDLPHQSDTPSYFTPHPGRMSPNSCLVRIPLMADSDSIPIADSVPCDGGHAARVS